MKTISDASSQGSGQLQTDNKIFFGNNNNNLNNILLGAAVGAGGVLAGQAIINGVNNNQCNCNGPNRKRRQIQLQQDQDQSQVDKDDGDKKIFGLFEGGNSCNCNAPSSVEFGQTVREDWKETSTMAVDVPTTRLVDCSLL